MELVVVPEVGPVALADGVEDHEDDAEVGPADAGAGLDVLGHGPRHAVEQHQVEPVDVHAVADHAGRDDGLDPPAWRVDVLQRVGDLVEGGLALEFGDGQLVQAMLPQRTR